jgi:multidrug efflux pump subunit AcrB
VTIGQSGVGTQVTNGFATIAYAMLVAIDLVYLIVVLLVYLLLVPLVIVFALPLGVIGAVHLDVVHGQVQRASVVSACCSSRPLKRTASAWPRTARPWPRRTPSPA